MTIYATTYGLGPFDPAISYNGRLYILAEERKFTKEDDAFAQAKSTVEEVSKDMEQALLEAGYVEIKP